MNVCSECGARDEVESSYCGSFCRECFEAHIEQCGVCAADTGHPFHPGEGAQCDN
jgi:hypothetical protein